MDGFRVYQEQAIRVAFWTLAYVTAGAMKGRQHFLFVTPQEQCAIGQGGTVVGSRDGLKEGNEDQRTKSSERLEKDRDLSHGGELPIAGSSFQTASESAWSS